MHNSIVILSSEKIVSYEVIISLGKLCTGAKKFLREIMQLPTRNSEEPVDHFILWSFIKDDNLWNFVLACPECNNRKRDKLANEKYLKDLVVRNSSIIIETHQDMRNYQEKRLLNIYKWALKNGYDEIWTPKQKAVM